MSEIAIREASSSETARRSEPQEPLWTGLGLVAPLEARISGGAPRRGATGVSIDTRTLCPGDLFFAISGFNSDGHDYVAAALEKGALAAVVDEAHAESLARLGPLYVVRDDVLAALERLGVAARARTRARIAAVTGSVGKTSTKEALRLALSAAGRTHASVASYNNHWGVPLTLARMPRQTEFGVFEIGMNHQGEITPLTRMVRPHVAIITTVAPVHMENFTGVEAIADAKAEIFAGLEPGGVAILPADNPQFERLAAAAKRSAAGLVTSFGADKHAEARLLDVRLAADHSMVEADICGQLLTYRLGAPGRHLAMNSLAVLLAAKALGVDPREAAQTLASFAAQPGRGQRLELQAPDGAFTLIDESYNANPASMRAAFDLAGALAPPSPGRRVAVLGDMLELGSHAADMHAGLAQDLAANHFDLVFAAGPLCKHLFDALPAAMRGEWRENAQMIAPAVAAAVHAGDLVIVKGSNGSKMSAVVEALKHAASNGSNEGRTA
ncbi:UDP-N-acetylmuramoylalanyl-D-glutamyl-2,6-diaminopimelate/D-alanyl-D-alanyl ligase [Methylocella silvestris BL2]|uniref:UDP-N-acetylmuramoyl-tripeptide--D-alanyl-D-alanine ligase n=1 Tax=Methylocella silvestris (strain DSM 15510 / CIP 108128 / LMG 27833 / NCIMB 13906 / BL2) TaxID=395965 RepID=B8ETL8_METSB|nr:UDP-N-acetylmuramoylalanyl-D-glutamyl-2,6-diaminopimelate--D-alanyl-D-alanine ligase [Methylocella silvestris]ACK52370.1 UDP-N-acetylmuramoylalanyl-D-glutamyl-2,6-diaminopimelate/D-alanyl-D-alanyl ligase [Methylocella silvestris BL2]